MSRDSRLIAVCDIDVQGAPCLFCLNRWGSLYKRASCTLQAIFFSITGRIPRGRYLAFFLLNAAGMIAEQQLGGVLGWPRGGEGLASGGGRSGLGRAVRRAAAM